MSEHYDLLRGTHRAGCRCVPCVEARFQVERDALKTRVEQLEQALRDYAEHQSWRCQYADKQYYLVHLPPEDDCACGFDKTMRGLGLYPDQRETT